MGLHLNETLTGTVRVHPHDRFIRCRINGAVFQGDAAGALWHGCTGAAGFAGLKRIELARMYGLNQFRGSLWPSLSRILQSPNQHDIIRAVMDDAGGSVALRTAGILTTSYHPDSSWVPIVKILDSEFGRVGVQGLFDQIAVAEISEKFNETKGLINDGDSGLTDAAVPADEPGEQWQFRAHRTKRAFRFNAGGRSGEVDLTVLPALTVPGDLQELEEKVAALITQETGWSDLPIRIYIGNPDYMGSWQIGHWDGDRYHELI